MKLPRWKKEQKERKSRQVKSSARFFIVGLFAVFILILGFSFLKIYTGSLLPKNGRTTILFSTSPVKILTFDQDGKVIFLQLPDNLYLESIYGYGQYKLGSLDALGKMEKRSGGLLAGSIQEFLGAPIDAVITDLNLWDRLKIWWKIKSTKTNQRQTIDLLGTGILDKYLLPDKSVGLTADQAKLDKQLTEIFRDSGVVSEHLTIEVLNGSAKPGIANRVTRLITNLGGTVISVGNSGKESNRCLLKAESQVLKSRTAQRLKGIYNCQEMITQILDSRADLQLIVGLDYWQKLNQR